MALARHTRKLFAIGGVAMCGIIPVAYYSRKRDDKGINFFGIKINDDGITMPGLTINDEGITMPGLKISDKGIEGSGIKINENEINIKGMRLEADGVEQDVNYSSSSSVSSFGNFIKSGKYIITRNCKKYEFTIIRDILHINDVSTNVKLNGKFSVSINNNEIIVNDNYIDLDDY